MCEYFFVCVRNFQVCVHMLPTHETADREKKEERQNIKEKETSESFSIPF